MSHLFLAKECSILKVEVYVVSKKANPSQGGDTKLKGPENG